MAEVMPFAGTRYVPKEGEVNLSDTVCPPYDDISPSLQEELHERSLYNIVRLVLGNESASDDESNNRYTRSAECYRDWKARGVLADEQRKCFYIYEQVFTLPGQSEPTSRLGFFALVKLQDFRSGKIRAHELTYDAPKLDRLKLLRTLQVNESPLYMLYRDEDESVDSVLREIMKKKAPTNEFTSPDGITHRVWMLYKKDPVLRIHEAMKRKILFIADGHHRYETALKYRDEMREMTGRRDGRQPYDFTLMFLQRAEDETLFTEAQHRILTRELGADVEMDEVIEDLEEFFDLDEFKLDMKALEKSQATVEKRMKPSKKNQTRFVMVLPNGRAWTLTLKPSAEIDEMYDEDLFMSDEMKRVDVVMLHKFVISRGWIGNPEMSLSEDDVFYRKDISNALDLLRRRKGCVAFFINAMTKDEIIHVAENGELLPHGSVNFFPKIPCGLVLRDHNVGFG